MPNQDLVHVTFRKSSHSEGGGCVEVGALGPQRLIRDSKNPQKGCLAMGPEAWKALLTKIKQGAYDL